MALNVLDFLAKIDNRITGTAFSRPRTQVHLLLKKLTRYHSGKFNKIIDVGGGFEPQYKSILSKNTKTYINLDIHAAEGVDIVGSVYNLPFKQNSIDAICIFMVLEHLEEPKNALRECYRVLHKRGYLLLTTVQYWHTHAHPNDFFRYTKPGLEYLCKESGFTVKYILSQGGPYLVAFHVIELNLPPFFRLVFSILFYRLAEYLDNLFFNHTDKRKNYDSVGWSLIAVKS